MTTFKSLRTDTTFREQRSAGKQGPFQRLKQVLEEECDYVDPVTLGYYCGLDKSWWLPESNYQLAHYLRLLSQLQVNEVPNIALRVARRTTISDSGLMGYAMLSSPNLKHALKLAVQIGEQLLQYLSINFFSRDELAFIECQVTHSDRNFSRVLQELWLVSIWRHIQVLMPDGVAACASYASLNYSSPTYHWEYQQLLGCQVEFDQKKTVLAIPKQWLYIAIQGNRSEAQYLYSNQARRLLKDQIYSQDIVSKVKRTLLEYPSECKYNLGKTATLLSLSGRTLRRYLHDAETSFRQLALEVRMELAADYLANTQLSIQEISYQLGYAQSNNFHRAFKNFYQCSPDISRKNDK